MKDKKTFGSFIKEKRLNKNYSQKELADLLYVTESAVSKWERGVTYPDITLITDICKVLEITEKELIQSGDDTEYRKIKRDSDKYNKIKKILFWILNIGYIVGLVTCFIVNLAVEHTLSWFFIVLTSIVVAYTFCPTVTWVYHKYKNLIFIGSTFVSLFLLFLTCSIYTNNYWFIIATIGVLLGYFVIFYPILFVKQKKYLTDEEYKKFSKCFLLTYVLGIFFLILLLLVSIYCYNPFNLGLGFLITSSCFIIPVLFGLLVLFGDTKKFVKPIIISLMGVLGLLFLYGVVSSLYLVSIGSSETYYIEQPYNNIKIELDTFDINIHLSENFENKIVSKENKKLYIEEKVIDNVLTIRQIDNRMFFEKFFDFNNFEVDLYLSQQSINLLNIECSTSDITIHDGFTFNNVVISNSTGDIKMYSDSVQAIQIESSTGDVEFYDVKCDTLDIELSTGNTKLTNVVLKNDFYFESSTGNLFLDGFDAANMYIVSSTGDVKGTILSSKFFVATSSTGDVTVPKTREGGECRITVSTGDIKIEYK